MHFTNDAALSSKTLGYYTQFLESVNGNTLEACKLRPDEEKNSSVELYKTIPWKHNPRRGPDLSAMVFSSAALVDITYPKR